LDGWDPIVELRFEAKAPSDKAAVIAEITPILPLVPRNEIKGFGEAENKQQRMLSSRRRVPPGVDWRTGEIDLELMTRIEKVKSKLL
jgi:hypothetical protein